MKNSLQLRSPYDWAFRDFLIKASYDWIFRELIQIKSRLLIKYLKDSLQLRSRYDWTFRDFIMKARYDWTFKELIKIERTCFNWSYKKLIKRKPWWKKQIWIFCSIEKHLNVFKSENASKVCKDNWKYFFKIKVLEVNGKNDN